MEIKHSNNFKRGLVGILALLFTASLIAFLYANYQAGDSDPWQLLASGLILSIPLALLYGLIGVIITVSRQKRQGAIDERLARIIFWSPRVAGIAIIFFISLFALDVFTPEYTLAEMLFAFLMHMLPSIGLAILLAVAWRWEWVGFVAFLAGALLFLRNFAGDIAQGMGMFLLFSGPMLMIALLFWLNWRWRSAIHSTHNWKRELKKNETGG